MLGPTASAQSLADLRDKHGLHQAAAVRSSDAICTDVVHGDLGTSWQTTRPVTEDLFQRFPATLELITFGLLLALAIGFPLGVAAARLKRGPVRKFADYYGLLAGATAGFLAGAGADLRLLHRAELDSRAARPHRHGGAAAAHRHRQPGDRQPDRRRPAKRSHRRSGILLLPVLTLGLINAGPILKMTQSTMERTLSSDFVRYAEMCGLPRRIVLRQAVRAALPSVVTIVSVLYGFLIGGAVLVEIVFSWGGAGQYAVQGVLNADINPVLGFVVFSAVLSLVIYLVVDLIYFALDPRMRG